MMVPMDNSVLVGTRKINGINVKVPINHPFKVKERNGMKGSSMEVIILPMKIARMVAWDR